MGLFSDAKATRDNQLPRWGVLMGVMDEIAAGGEEDRDFAREFASHHASLVRFAYLLCGDLANAEDVVDEVFARTLPRWRKNSIDNLGQYLRRGIVNELTSQGRRRRLWKRVAPAAAHETARQSLGSDHGVHDHLVLWTLVNQLPLRQRAVVILRVLEDRSEAETAELVGISVGAVKSHLSRALARLRTHAAEVAGHG